MTRAEFFLVFLFLFILVNLSAQTRQTFCGTPVPASPIFVDVDKIQQDRGKSVVLPEVVKVFVHFTTNDLGTLGVVSIDTFMARFQDMKDFFYPQNICFLFMGSDIIQNSDLDDHHIFGMGPANNEQDEVLPYVLPGVLNVFVHHLLTFGNVTGGGNAYSIPNTYLSLDDGALSESCCVGILTHEVGHCLGLYHTFQWSWGGSGQVRENVARTGSCANCSTKGDLLCDTPADPHQLATIGTDTTYLLVWDHTTNCVFDTSVLDVCNDLYDPDETNIMSYFPDSCHSHFSSGQGLRALSFLNGSLEVLKAPENLPVTGNGTYNTGQYFHAAKQEITYTAANLMYLDAAILWSVAGNSVSVGPGTTFSPSTGFTLLSAQSACQ